MTALILAIALTANTPSPSGSKDVVSAIYYAPNPAHLPGITTLLAGSAESSIRLATWKLTDGTLAAALSQASTRGVSVGVVLDLTGGTDTAQQQIARQLVSSGGTVYNAQFPRHIANNFMVADGNYSLQGNYYFSPTATQTGSYLLSVSGTHAASVNLTTWTTLAESGSMTMDFRTYRKNPTITRTATRFHYAERRRVFHRGIYLQRGRQARSCTTPYIPYAQTRGLSQLHVLPLGEINPRDRSRDGGSYPMPSDLQAMGLYLLREAKDPQTRFPDKRRSAESLDPPRRGSCPLCQP